MKAIHRLNQIDHEDIIDIPSTHSGEPNRSSSIDIQGLGHRRLSTFGAIHVNQLTFFVVHFARQ
jgi:tRNA 2-selenouridine synthase SelU